MQQQQRNSSVIPYVALLAGAKGKSLAARSSVGEKSRRDGFVGAGKRKVAYCVGV